MENNKKENRKKIIMGSVLATLVLVIAYATFAQPLAYRARLAHNRNKNIDWLWWFNAHRNEEKKEGIKDKSSTNIKPQAEEKKIISKKNKPIINKKPKSSNKPSDNNSNNNLMWDTGFVDAKLNKKEGESAEVDGIEYTKNMATYNVRLYEPGASVTYNFTIKNLGKIDAEVASINKILANPEDNIVLFTTEGLDVGDVIKIGKSKVLKVTTTFNPNFTGNIVNYKTSIKIIINYKQH